jgi:hypothetical protein
MEYSIPIPQGNPGMEWNLEYSMVEPTSKIIRRTLSSVVRCACMVRYGMLYIMLDAPHSKVFFAFWQ